MFPTQSPKKQRGISLIIALMVLAILTIAGVAVVGLSSVELRIAQNEKTSQVAFEAAESGLRRIIRSPTVRQSDINPFINGTDPVADVINRPFTSTTGEWSADVEIKPLGASLPCPIAPATTAGGSTKCVFYEITSTGSVRTLAQRGAVQTIVGSVYVRVSDGDASVSYGTD